MKSYKKLNKKDLSQIQQFTKKFDRDITDSAISECFSFGAFNNNDLYGLLLFNDVGVILFLEILPEFFNTKSTLDLIRFSLNNVLGLNKKLSSFKLYIPIDKLDFYSTLGFKLLEDQSESPDLMNVWVILSIRRKIDDDFNDSLNHSFY